MSSVSRACGLVATVAALTIAVGACGDSPGGSDAANGEAPKNPASTHRACFEDGERFEGEARLYIEHNATDEDTGVHGMFDQEGLAEGCLQKPDGDPILLLDPANKLNALGINQFFFESREPPADEYSIADLKAEFPEGEYRMSGIDFKGTRRVATARFTHAIPRPAEIVSPTVVAEERGEENKVSRRDLTVRWRPVTETLEGRPVEITGYEVIVTKEEHDDPHALSRPEYDVHVPPEATELSVPEDFLEPDTLYELEVLALEESGNQTISLGFFTTE